MKYDHDVWETLDPDDMWVYDKVILSKKLGYVCAPGGVPVPEPNNYIVRPITNFEGMGMGAEIVWIENETWEQVPPGYFWSEVFTGRHLSVDYTHGDQVLCVEGFRNPNDPLYKWERWERVDDFVPFPEILVELGYEHINCEFIGGKLIEVHLRHNPDFANHEYSHVLPVWKGQMPIPKPGYRFIEDTDEAYNRLGFYVPIQ